MALENKKTNIRGRIKARRNTVQALYQCLLQIRVRMKLFMSLSMMSINLQKQMLIILNYCYEGQLRIVGNLIQELQIY